jgi:hypothetical protein
MTKRFKVWRVELLELDEGEQPKNDEDCDTVVLLADYEAATAALKVAYQALLETRHAQDVGSNWYTKGESGLYRQVDMWVRKGMAAIAKVCPEIT